MAAEQRRAPRHSLNVRAVAEVRVECSVCDISQTGARLAVDDPSLLPEQFILDIDNKVRRWCRVSWRSETEVGVQFTGGPNAAGNPA